jgi:hypothetical protein
VEDALSHMTCLKNAAAQHLVFADCR